MELALPPRPVPRRKRAFIMPNQVAPPPPLKPQAEVVLDGFVLLEACRCEDPDEAEKAVLEGCGITSVISEDLSFFRKLSHLDLGDNRVPLAALAYLPALLELHLDCNGLAEVSIPTGGFPALEVLNLSYNGLTSAGVAALADIPRLRQLDVSMNGLSALPATMEGFQQLQSLNCEHNKLGSEASWIALGSLPALRSLSLAHNRIEALAPSAAETTFMQLATLDLAHNLIAREEALLPVLQMTSLRTLLLYGNPFLHRGAASDDFHEVLANQRGIDLVTTPPPPPPPPAKIDLSSMTTVAEPPVRRKIPSSKPMPNFKKPAKPPPAKPPPQPDDDDAGGSSFFLTAGGDDSAEQQAMLTAQAHALDQDVWGPADEMFDAAVDIRTAVTALKAAIERPPVAPTNASADHLKLTQSLKYRQRPKFVAPEAQPRTKGAAAPQKLVNGMAAPQRAGGAVEDMTSGIGELQQRMGAQAANASVGGALLGGTLDPDGDACVSSLQSMLHAMQDMSVGAGGGGALPQQA